MASDEGQEAEATDAEAKRIKSVFVYVLGTISDMKKHGLLEGGVVDLTPDGMKEYHELKAAGFQPTRDEIEGALDYLQSDDFCDALDEAKKT